LPAGFPSAVCGDGADAASDNRKKLAMLPDGVRLVEADVHDPQRWRSDRRADAVINLVGILHDGDSSQPYGKRFAAAHVELPKKIVAAMKQPGVRRLLHMSALKAAADAPSAYLRSKAAGEGVVLAAAGTDLDVTVFRPSVIFGPATPSSTPSPSLLAFPDPAAGRRQGPLPAGLCRRCGRCLRRLPDPTAPILSARPTNWAVRASTPCANWSTTSAKLTGTRGR
jgi:nucleoside-diphosphate-sugar epimerase